MRFLSLGAMKGDRVVIIIHAIPSHLKFKRDAAGHL
jgi:hypothetical protein